MEGVTKANIDKDGKGVEWSTEGVIQKVKYILEGRGWNEVPLGKGVQNTAIGSGMSQEINRETSQYPSSWRLGRAEVRNTQRVSLWRAR